MISARPKILLIIAILASFVISLFSHSINPYYMDVIIGIGINITLAVSLNLINGYTGQFSLGHAGFMAVGAYTAAMITTTFASHFHGLLNTQVLFLFALLAGGLLAALTGLVVGSPSLRLKGDYLAIVTLGFGEIIRVVLENTDAVGASRGLTGIPLYTNFFWTFSVAALTIYIIVSMVNSSYGRGFLAVRDDEIAAEAIGINTTRYKVIAFVVGAFFAGIAGGLYAHFKQYLNPDGFGFLSSIEIVVMVILGGMGNTAGVVLAAILLTLLPEALRALAGHQLPLPFLEKPLSLKWIAETRMIIYSLALIFLMILRPRGLFTWKKKLRPLPSALPRSADLSAAQSRPSGASPAEHARAAKLLQLENCTLRFGGLTAVSDLTMVIRPNELAGLIGPNGAGKTTVFNLITGVYQPTSGKIEFDENSINKKRPYQITAHGVARTFQNIRLFPSLSVFDNVRVAFHLHLVQGIWHAVWRGAAFTREERQIEEQTMEMLEIFHLGHLRDVDAKNLPYGDQRLLEIVRALATRPQLLLLDEPAAGMNATEKVELMKLIQFVKEKYKLSILLVEHDMQVVMGICQRIIVLDYGVKIAAGTPEEVRCNPKVIEAYLGD